MALVFVSELAAFAVIIGSNGSHVRGLEWHSRSWPIGCEALWIISVGLLTVKLDHFFIAAP